MTANINIKADARLKKKAEKLFSDLGMNMTTALNIFLRQSVRENRIPFVVTRDVPNAETRKAMDDALSGKDMHGPFDSVEELMHELRK